MTDEDLPCRVCGKVIFPWEILCMDEDGFDTHQRCCATCHPEIAR